MNLNEYPKDAQLKKVTADRSIPASRSQRERVEKMIMLGIPAENPRNSIAVTRGWKKDERASFHDLPVTSP